jgi:hypothetical protein
MTNHPNRSVAFDTVEVVYYGDKRSALWTETYDGGFPQQYSANRYATFHGWDTSLGRQVHGWASTPVTAADSRRYFLQRPGFAKRMQFRRVDSFAELQTAERDLAQTAAQA